MNDCVVCIAGEMPDKLKLSPREAAEIATLVVLQSLVDGEVSVTLLGTLCFSHLARLRRRPRGLTGKRT